MLQESSSDCELQTENQVLAKAPVAYLPWRDFDTILTLRSSMPYHQRLAIKS